MQFSFNTLALAGTVFIAFTTASPTHSSLTKANHTDSSPSFWGGLNSNSSVSAGVVIGHLEEHGSIKWVPASGGGYMVSIEEGTWDQGVERVLANSSLRRRSTGDSSIHSRAVTTGLIDGFAGSIKCYGSGSSASDTKISSFVVQACDALVDNLLPPAGKAAAKGAYLLWTSGTSDYVKFGAKLLTNSWAAVNTTMCQDAFQAYNDYCQEDGSSSTKGGVLSMGIPFGKKVIQWVVDPTK